MKIFKIKDLDLYITNVGSKEEAVIISHLCGWGIHKNDLSEVKSLPKDIEIYGPSNKPSFEPDQSFAIDPNL